MPSDHAHKIAVLSGSKSFRQDLQAALRHARDWKIIGEAKTIDQAVELIAYAEPMVAIVEVDTSRKDGCDRIRSLRAALKTSIVAVGPAKTHKASKQALQAGAQGYVPQEDIAAGLVSELERLRAGLLLPGVSDSAPQDLSNKLFEKQLSVPGLTHRETEIVGSIAEGMSNKEIAVALKISIRTVETHRASIIRKCNLGSSTSLVRYAVLLKFAPNRPVLKTAS